MLKHSRKPSPCNFFIHFPFAHCSNSILKIELWLVEIGTTSKSHSTLFWKYRLFNNESSGNRFFVVSISFKLDKTISINWGPGNASVVAPYSAICVNVRTIEKGVPRKSSKKWSVCTLLPPQSIGTIEQEIMKTVPFHSLTCDFRNGTCTINHDFTWELFIKSSQCSDCIFSNQLFSFTRVKCRSIACSVRNGNYQQWKNRLVYQSIVNLVHINVVPYNFSTITYRDSYEKSQPQDTKKTI